MGVSGRGARNKGLNFERKIVNDLKSIGVDAKRNLEDIVDNNKVDVMAHHFKIQCKRLKNYCPVNIIEDIRSEDPLHVPVLITKADRKKEVACLYWEDLLNMLSAIYKDLENVQKRNN